MQITNSFTYVDKYKTSGTSQPITNNQILFDKACKNDVVSFSGKRNTYNHTAEYKQLQALLEYDIPCPACGKVMIHPSIFKKMENSGIFEKSSSEIIEALQPYKNSLHEENLILLNKFEGIIKKIPSLKSKTFEEILQLEKNRLTNRKKGLYRNNLISEILYESGSLPKSKFYQLYGLCTKTTTLISDCKFTDADNLLKQEIEKILPEEKYSNSKNKISALIENSKIRALSNEDEVFLNYTLQKDSSIAKSMVRQSSGSIDHIYPKSIYKNMDYKANWLLICSKDNYAKSNMPLSEYLNQSPRMIENSQKHFDRLIELCKEGKLDKQYLINLKKTLTKASEGKIKIDLKELKSNNLFKNTIHALMQLLNKFLKLIRIK